MSVEKHMAKPLKRVVPAAICLVLSSCVAGSVLAASGGEALSGAARAAISRAIRADRERDLARNADGAFYTASATTAEFFQEAKLTASDGAERDQLGTSIAVSGDTVVVGVPQMNVEPAVALGAAYVFVKPAGGWAAAPALQAKLTASDATSFDGFGWSVSVSGDTVVVGAPFATIGSNLQQGAAYVFVKPSTGWTTTSAFDAKLTASDGTRITDFAYSVAVSGDTVVLGAPAAMIGSYYAQGAAYVFVKEAGGWVTTSAFEAKLTASDGTGYDDFGASVAITGDTVIAGTASVKIGLNPGLGSAYVFVKPLGGWATTSAFDAKLTASDGVPGDYFGLSTAISNDTVIVGAAGAPDGSDGSEEGAVYVFERLPAGWVSSTEDAKLTPSDGGVLDYFGTSVAISGDTVVVGALQAMVAGAPSAATAYSNSGLGAAYVFVKPSSGWATTSAFDAKLSASDGSASASQYGDGFGTSVAISGDTIVAGAPAGTVGSNFYQGAAYVFERCPTARVPGRRPCIEGVEPDLLAPVKGREP